MAFAPDGRHLYVATRQALVTVDTGSWQVTGTTDVAPNPTAVAVAPDGRTGWVTGDGAVSVLNLT
jgi:collagen type III alpha